MKAKQTQRKKTLRENNADRITNLPDDVIQRILTFLPVKEAAKTAALSKQWRHNWRAKTNQLVFDGDFGRISKEGDYGLNAGKLMFEILKALLAHDGPITKFVLEIPGLKRASPDIDPLLHRLVKKGLQELALVFNDDEVNNGQPKIEREMPPALFSALQLSSLKLRGCDFRRAPSSFLGFSKLTHLELANVNVSTSFYRDFLPKCPLLQILKLFICDSAAVESHLKAEFVAPSLKVLRSTVWNVCFKYTPLLSVVSILPFDSAAYCKQSGFDVYNPDIAAVFASLPAIQELLVGPELLLFFASGHVPFKLPRHLHQLKVLSVDGILLYRLLEARVLCCLIMSTPNLQRLLIWSSFVNNLPPTEVIDSLQLLLEAEDVPPASCFECLEEFDIDNCQGRQVELYLVRLVLTSAPRLRRISLDMAHTVGPLDGFEFLKEVTQCKRASTEAEVTCVLNHEKAGTS